MQDITATRFEIGATVFFGKSGRTIYKIVAKLAGQRGDSPSYQIKSLNTGETRAAHDDQLRKALVKEVLAHYREGSAKS